MSYLFLFKLQQICFQIETNIVTNLHKIIESENKTFNENGKFIKEKSSNSEEIMS